MCFLAEAKSITNIREKKRNGNQVLIINLKNEDVPVYICISALQIHIDTELSGKIVYYRQGINGTSWPHLQEFFEKFNITLPNEKIPCSDCDGHQCFVLCNRQNEAEDNVIQLNVA